MLLEAAILLKAEQKLTKSIDSLIDLSKKEVKSRFLKWKAKGELADLLCNIRQVGIICTIASRQPSTVDEIYYPAKVRHGSGNRVIISSDDLFPNNTRLAFIQGTAGQGKSVFLRFLCLRDLDYSGKIPIFIELRKIDNGIDIFSLLKAQLKIIGLEENLIEPALISMLGSGSVRIYLDGLDEVKREYALDTKDKINTLINKYPKLQIILTSRPGALSQNLMDMLHMQQFQIAPLTEKDHAGFFAKIGTHPETKERLLTAIEKSNAQIKSLLTTPLMLTLLVLTCGQKQDLPDTLPEFYDSLFNLLSSMHDGVKPGFIRQKATTLSSGELESLFRAFSYASKQIFGKTSLNLLQFEKSLTAALKITDLKCTQEGFRTDVTETVCLMVKDGVETAFTHKSIQEYYTASFINRIEDDETAKSVFEDIDGENLYSWINELRFLEDFQNIAYENSIGIPHGRNLAEQIYLPGKKKPTIGKIRVNSLLQQMGIRVARGSKSKSSHGVYWMVAKNTVPNRYLPDLINEISREFIAHTKKTSPSQIPGDSLEFVPLKIVLKEDPELAERIYATIQRYADALTVKTKRMRERQLRQKRGLIDIISKKNSIKII